jgi:hypothetical protein
MAESQPLKSPQARYGTTYRFSAEALLADPDTIMRESKSNGILQRTVTVVDHGIYHGRDISFRRRIVLAAYKRFCERLSTNWTTGKRGENVVCGARKSK